jgi:hypothetical protein
MKGKGKNFGGRHQKGLVQPASKPQPSKPRITLEQIRSKRKVEPNQALIDADAAENLALSLLQVCADSTEQFAALAEGDDKVSGAGAGAIKETALTSSSNTTSTSSTNSITSSDSNGEQDRVEMIRKNGNLIQTKLKQIHELLAPHAHLIVNYSHEQCKPKPVVEEEEKSDEPDGESKDRDDASNQEDEDMTRQDEEKKENEKKKEDEKKEDQNMYSSRLEMRLAIERRNLLKDLLKLEKQRQLRKSATDCTDINTVDKSGKRKRED